jgi:hypothetical protein
MSKGSFSLTTSVGCALPKTAASKQRCAWTDPGAGLGNDDQIAEAPAARHHRLDLARLLCPGRKAGVETPARGFGKVVAGSPVDEALLLLSSRFLRLPLDYLARHSGSEDHVRKVGKSGIRVGKDEQRANVRIHSPSQYESGVQKRFARQLRSQRHKDRTNHFV